MKRRAHKQADLFQVTNSYAKELIVLYVSNETRVLHFPFAALDIASLQNAKHVTIVDNDFKKILFMGMRL